MGWELHLRFPHPKWSSSPLYDPRGIWNSPHESCRVCWLVQEHRWPRHPSTSYRLWWVDLSHSLGSSSLQPWIFLDYIHYGQSLIDRTATLSMRIRPLYAPDLVIHDLPSPWPIHDILDHHWALRPWLESPWPSISHMTTSRHGIQLPYVVQSIQNVHCPLVAQFQALNSCKGFLLLHAYIYPIHAKVSSYCMLTFIHFRDSLFAA